MGFLKGAADGQEIFCHASDVKDAIGEPDGRVRASSVQRQDEGMDVTCVERAPPPLPPTVVNAVDPVAKARRRRAGARVPFYSIRCRRE